MNVLLTGGAGYIGSHAYVALADAGFAPVILDDFSNSSTEVLQRLGRITNGQVFWERGNVCDGRFVAKVIRKYAIDAAMHFAAYKSIPESLTRPIDYYRNNVTGLVTLLEAMEAEAVRTLVYSSSASVYGIPDSCPITENFPRKPTNPYALTKVLGEDILSSLARSDFRWRVALLRYFNPVGAHPLGLIGEEAASQTPGNLMPAILRVATGKGTHLSCFGSDYPTRDGTGVRDYIHVMDLAEGHVAALKKLAGDKGWFTVNLGTGLGYSVLEMVRSFEKVSGKCVQISMEPRRAGDVAECWADPALAHSLLGWRATRSLEDMCRDAWHWQTCNPSGYSLAT